MLHFKDRRGRKPIRLRIRRSHRTHPSLELETNVLASSIRRFAPLTLTLVALGLAGCETVGGGVTRHIAVVEEDTQGTSKVNIASLTDVITRNPSDPSAYNTRGAAYARVGRYGDAIADFTKAV